jgi:hypothetical protein
MTPAPGNSVRERENRRLMTTSDADETSVISIIDAKKIDTIVLNNRS